MGFVFLLICFVYLLGVAIVLVISKKLIGLSYKIVALVGIVLILLPFWRYMLVSAVFNYYEKTPLQEIYKTIEKPGSVYWKDNVWPGFNEYYTKAMIECYLDGIYLHTLALNGDEGRIYLYHAKPEDFSKSKALLPEIVKRQKEIKAIEAESVRIKSTKAYKESSKENKAEHRKQFGNMINKADLELVPLTKQYKKQRSQDIQSIINRAEIFDSTDDLPFMNYKVEFNKVPVSPSLLDRLIIADKITITDNKTKEMMGFSKRYLAYSGWVSRFSGNLPKFDGCLGYEYPYTFDHKVLFKYPVDKGHVRSKIGRQDELYGQ